MTAAKVTILKGAETLQPVHENRPPANYELGQVIRWNGGDLKVIDLQVDGEVLSVYVADHVS